jgi:hypothetical protein
MPKRPAPHIPLPRGTAEGDHPLMTVHAAAVALGYSDMTMLRPPRLTGRDRRNVEAEGGRGGAVTVPTLSPPPARPVGPRMPVAGG